VRTRRDLLEAIAFPAASFVRSYEPVQVKRRDGSVAYGIIANEGAAALTLTTGPVTPPVTIPRSEIAEITPGTASLMPQGIDRILPAQELADLVAFLQSLR
jgi:putative heme-binding domain-containing protein